MAQSIQSNIKQPSRDIDRFSFFLGGLNVKHSALEQYSPLRTGYARIFMTRMPVFMKEVFPTETKMFKHMIEYGNVGIDGIQNLNFEFETMVGGYAARQFEVGNVAKDETQEVTIKLYESTGSPVREYTDLWINGISDHNTGIGHYHGALDMGRNIVYNQANHTAEAIYVVTDPTGRSDAIEYACLLTNMMPKNVKKDHFNYEPGQHPVIQVDVPFTCTKYESPDVNLIAKALISKYQILNNYMHFKSGYTPADINALPASNIQDWPTSP